MFIEEMFGLKNDNSIDEYYFSNLIEQLNSRIYLYDIDLNCIDIEDDIYFNLSRAISYDISNIDWYIGDKLKNTILKFYVKVFICNKDIEEDLNELKWFLISRIQGYMPYTHNLLYNL